MITIVEFKPCLFSDQVFQHIPYYVQSESFPDSEGHLSDHVDYGNFVLVENNIAENSDMASNATAS